MTMAHHKSGIDGFHDEEKHRKLRRVMKSQKEKEQREEKEKQDGFSAKNRAPRSIKDKDRDGVDAVFHHEVDDGNVEYNGDDKSDAHSDHDSVTSIKGSDGSGKKDDDTTKKHKKHNKDIKGGVDSATVREAKDYKESLIIQNQSLSDNYLSTCDQMFGDKFGVCQISSALTVHPVTGISFIFFLLTFCTIALCRYRRRNPTYRRNQHANLHVGINTPWDFSYTTDDGKGEYMAVELLEGDFGDDITSSSYAASYQHDSDDESLESIISEWSATKDFNDVCGTDDDPLTLEEVNG